MPEITPVSTADHLCMMLYAPPGWWKTSLVATTPDAGFKTLLIRSPMDKLPKRALQANMDQVVVRTWEDMTGGDGIQDHLRFDDHGYDFVWLDCLSIMQDVLLDDVWEGTIAEKPHRAYLLSDTGEILGPNLSPTSGLDKGEFGRNMERIQQFVRHIVGADSFHFGITCHPFEGPHPTDDEGGTLLVPYIQGKGMTSKICGYCNVVAFQELMEDGDEIFARLHTRENPRFYAKDLHDAFPDGYLDNPTMPKIMEAIKGQEKKTKGRRRRGVAPANGAKPKPGRRRRGAPA